MSIIEEFKLRADEDGIPIFNISEWQEFRKKYDKQDIKNELANYIIDNKIKFPLKQITKDKFEETFKRFCETNHHTWLYYPPPQMVSEKFDYKYKYSDKPLGVVKKSHHFNVVSDYFQQENRMQCGSLTTTAPIDIWMARDKLKTMNWHFWRDGVLDKTGITKSSFRTAFRLGTYTATQFKPSVAKHLYEYHGAKDILDTSCGWGDRLAGFYGTPGTNSYLGCDPNPMVYEVYKQQCLEYERLLGSNPTLIDNGDHFICNGSKTVTIWNKPAEDVNWDIYENTIDLYFTSPPYFATEKYADGTGAEENQSWCRYNTFESWRDDFLFFVIGKVWKTLRKGGYMMLNIIEPCGKIGRHQLCDSMVEYCVSLDGCNYVGKIGMRMMGRPHTDDLEGCMIEPIWTFVNGSAEYNVQVSLEEFMG